MIIIISTSITSISITIVFRGRGNLEEVQSMVRHSQEMALVSEAMRYLHGGFGCYRVGVRGESKLPSEGCQKHWVVFAIMSMPGQCRFEECHSDG